MSLTACFIDEEHNTKNDNAMVTYHPLGESPNYALYNISTMFVNIQQIKTNLNAEHQYEKHELIRLNECLCLFIDRVQQLEQQNAKYVAILADFRRKSSNISVFGTEWDERHIHLQADLMTISCKNIGYENHFEVFQMQSEIYKQLIHIINQSSNEQRLKLQQELDHSSSTLINVRTSYEELQKKIEGLHVEREDIFQQYLKVANNWGHWKKEISELKVSVKALKNQHVFYKDIRSHVTK
jgi:chromosome segregation ATPase